MSGFAPSYYNESNHAWLNDLVSDIIDPSSREQSRVDSASPRYNCDQDIVDDVDSDRDYRWSLSQNSSLRRQCQSNPPNSYYQESLTSGRSRRSPSYNGAIHYSYNSTSRPTSNSPADYPSSSTPVRDLHIEPISEDGSLLHLDPFHQPPPSFSPDSEGITPSATFQATPLSQRALQEYSKQSAILGGAESVTSSKISQRRASSLHRNRYRQLSPWSDETYTEDARDKNVPSQTTADFKQMRTSLGRTVSQQRLSAIQKPQLAKVASNASVIPEPNVFSGFAPHPAVRPFGGDRKVLGEAAGPCEDDDHAYPAKLALILIIVGICCSVFIISVDRSIVTTAIPQITATFNSYSDIGWYGSAYFLTASAFQPLYGRVYMSFDTRWSFLTALAVFELGSLLGALSPSSDVLILGRAIQGVGSAGILTGSFVVATHSVPLQGRPVLFAVIGILYGVGALAGPLLGGVFTDLLTWRWAFWINLPIGFVTFVGVFFFFKPRQAKQQTERPTWIRRILALDLIGNAILLGACIMLFLALQMSETSGTWSTAPVIGLLSGFGVTTVIFIAWLLYRGDKALIPPRIVRQRTVASSCGIAFFLYGGLLVHAYFLPIWFQGVKGDSAIHSGVNMIPYMLANALFSLLAGIFVSKNGLFAPPAIIGCAIGTVGSGFLATLNASTSSSKWIGYEILVSAGLGMAIQQGFSAVQTALPLEEVPIGTAAVVACQSLGGAIFVSIGNTLFQDKLLAPSSAAAVPGVDVRAVFEAGATMFRSIVPADEIPAMVDLYNRSLRYCFILAIPLIGCAFLCSCCMEWNSVKMKQELARKQKVQQENMEKA